MGKRHSRLVGLTWWGTTPGDGMLSYADEMWDAIPGRTTSFWEGGKTVMCWRVSGPAFFVRGGAMPSCAGHATGFPDIQ